MQWRAWLGLKPTEAEFVKDLIRDRPDAAAWVYDPKARTLSQSGNVLSLTNIFTEFSSAPKARRHELLVKNRALMAPEKISALWIYSQTRIHPLMRSTFKGWPHVARARAVWLEYCEKSLGRGCLMHRHVGIFCVILGTFCVLAAIALFVYLFTSSPLFH